MLLLCRFVYESDRPVGPRLLAAACQRRQTKSCEPLIAFSSLGARAAVEKIYAQSAMEASFERQEMEEKLAESERALAESERALAASEHALVEKQCALDDSEQDPVSTNRQFKLSFRCRDRAMALENNLKAARSGLSLAVATGSGTKRPRSTDEESVEDVRKRAAESSHAEKKMKQLEAFAQSVNEKLVCPISLRLCVRPVVAQDGRVYERDAIERWLSSKSRSPLTNAPMGARLLDCQSTRTLILSAIETGVVEKEAAAAWHLESAKAKALGNLPGALSSVKEHLLQAQGFECRVRRTMMKTPPGWKKCYSEKLNKYYWHNTIKKVTIWVHPNLSSLYGNGMKKFPEKSKEIPLLLRAVEMKLKMDELLKEDAGDAGRELKAILDVRGREVNSDSDSY